MDAVEKIKKILMDNTRSRNGVNAIFMEDDYNWDGLAAKLWEVVRKDVARGAR